MIPASRARLSLCITLFNNFGSALGAKAAGLLLGVVAYGVLARTVGTAGLGRYRTVLTLLLFAGVLFDFGLYSITLRDISQPAADAQRILGNAVALRIVATSFVIVLLAIALSMAGAPSATGVMIAGAGWVALQLSELLRAVFQLKLAQPRGALAEVIGAAATLVLVLALAGLHAGTDSMLAATAAGFCCTAAVSWRFASRLLPFRLRFEWPLWRSLILAGLPIGGSLIFQTVQLRADVVFLALLRSPAELGLYDAPLKLYELLFAVPLLFGGLMLPLYVRDLGTRAGSVAPRLNAALGVSFFFSMLTFAVLIECAEPAVVLFAGPGFRDSADPLRILAGSAIFAGVSGTLRFGAVAINQQSRILRADIIGMCAALTAHSILIPRYGIIGAAFGKLCGDIVTSVSAAIIMRKVLSRTIVMMVTVSAAAAACLICTVSFAVDIDVPWFVASGIGVPVILGAFLLLPRVRRMLAPLAAS